MHPVLFVLPVLGVKIHAYGVMILLACSGALAITVWRANRERLDGRIVYELATWLFLGGVIGRGRSLSSSTRRRSSRLGDLFRSWEGGNVFYGCIIGGLIGSLLYWWRRPFPFWPMADAVAPALAVGIALGRLGCFLNGCCFGVVSDLPWALRFPSGSHVWHDQVDRGILPLAAEFSLPVHPIQLYAAVAGLIILVALSWYFPRRRRDGEVMALLMILYPVTRWPIESLRGDEQAIFLGMTLSQNISVVLLSLGLIVGSILLRRPRARLADGATERYQPGEAPWSMSTTCG